MAKRRSRGEGSVTLTPHGRWKAVFVVQTVKEGEKRKRVIKNFKIKADALEWLQRQRESRRAGTLDAGSSMLFSEWFDKWLVMKSDTVDKRTIGIYDFKCRRHLIQHLGGKELKSIAPETVLELNSKLNSDGVGQNTRWYVSGRLRSILGDAVKPGLISTNPATRIARPKRPNMEMTAWTADEARRFLEFIKGHPYENLYRFCSILVAGLPRQSACGGKITIRKLELFGSQETLLTLAG